jgi:hypothetical protein
MMNCFQVLLSSFAFKFCLQIQVAPLHNGGEAAGMVTITGSGFGPAGAMYSQYFTSVFLGRAVQLEACVCTYGIRRRWRVYD